MKGVNMKRMRLPNGFGQISKLKRKNLRNPWRAMVTTGWTVEGKPIRRAVGYYPTYNEAYQALMKYHDDPSILDGTTLAELYDMWSTEKYKKIKAINQYKVSWKRCETIAHMRVRDVRARHVKAVVEADMPPSMHQVVKSLLIMMFDYAIEHDIADKNYAKLATTDTKYEINGHIIYTEKELNSIWENDDIEGANLLLIMCYTGLRPNELLDIKTANVNINDWYMTGGFKTDAGRNRIIPIHKKIRPFIKELYDPSNRKLVEGTSYHILLTQVKEISYVLSLNKKHKPHDGRKTFITRMKEANANDYAIKRIVGHNIGDLTEEVYTERSLDWLMEEIHKIS